MTDTSTNDEAEKKTKRSEAAKKAAATRKRNREAKAAEGPALDGLKVSGGDISFQDLVLGLADGMTSNDARRILGEMLAEGGGSLTVEELERFKTCGGLLVLVGQGDDDVPPETIVAAFVTGSPNPFVYGPKLHDPAEGFGELAASMGAGNLNVALGRLVHGVIKTAKAARSVPVVGGFVADGISFVEGLIGADVDGDGAVG